VNPNLLGALHATSRDCLEIAERPLFAPPLTAHPPAEFRHRQLESASDALVVLQSRVSSKIIMYLRRSFADERWPETVAPTYEKVAHMCEMLLQQAVRGATRVSLEVLADWLQAHEAALDGARIDLPPAIIVEVVLRDGVAAVSPSAAELRACGNLGADLIAMAGARCSPGGDREAVSLTPTHTGRTISPPRRHSIARARAVRE
jgi:hypothetical protein